MLSSTTDLEATVHERLVQIQHETLLALEARVERRKQTALLPWRIEYCRLTERLLDAVDDVVDWRLCCRRWCGRGLIRSLGDWDDPGRRRSRHSRVVAVDHGRVLGRLTLRARLHKVGDGNLGQHGRGRSSRHWSDGSRGRALN
jgi:hypothetical protein